MMPAAKHFDPVLGVDIHIIQPPGPVPPIPIPHPFVGIVMDPFDYVPILGATVYVNGVPRGQAGTEVKAAPPHIPIGGVFVKPPGNEGEIFMGSATVLVDGEPFSHMTLPVLTCNDIGAPPPPRPKKKSKLKSLLLPSSVVLPIPAGPPVLVGGPPTISMMAVGMKVGMKALGKLGKGIKRLQKGGGRIGRASKKVSRRVHKSAKKAMDKLGVPPNVQNKVHRGICSVTGHPVDIATGKVFTEQVDFELPGHIPLKWERIWYSTSVYKGNLGHGWHHCYDLSINVDSKEEVVVLRMADGRPVAFPILQSGEKYFDRKERLTLFKQQKSYTVLTAEQYTYHFSATPLADGVQPLVAIEDNMGHLIRFHFDEYGTPLGLTDSAGRHLHFKTNSRQQIIAITAPHPDKNKSDQKFYLVRYRYDKKGNLIEVLDALNQSEYYKYQQYLLIQETNRNGLSFYFNYEGDDHQARCIQTWGDNGIYHRKLFYNDIENSTVVENSLGHKTHHYKNDNGIVTKVVDAKGNITLTSYNENNEIISEIDALGQTRSYTYDESGNTIKTIQEDGSTLMVQYDQFNNPIEAQDTIGGIWKWKYDHLGRLIKRCNPNNEETHYYYSSHYLSHFTDAMGGETYLYYDQQGNLSGIRTEDEAESYWEYDKLGRAILITDPKGNKQYRQFDLLDRLISINEPDGNQRKFNYDAEGNIIYVKDKQHEVQLAYSGLGRLIKRAEAGTTVQFAYDTEEQLIGIKNEQGFVYRFELDQIGDVTVESGFDQIKRIYHRDALGRVEKTERPNHLNTEYQYSASGQVTTVKHSDGATEHYQYRRDGELLSAINDSAKIHFERDALGRITKEYQGDDYWVASEYNAIGLRTHMSSSLGAVQNIERNVMGDVMHIRYHSTPPETEAKNHWEVQFKRDQLGLEIERQLPGGIRSRWQRDKLGRPLRQQLLDGDHALRDVRYQWDVNDRLKSVVDAQKGITKYAHDALGNLVGAQYADGEIELRMPDAVGNLFHNKARNDRKYGAAGQLLETYDKAGTTYYQYDAEGNLIKKTESNESEWHYRWNTVGMLQEVIRPDRQVVNFTYDALGRRVSKTFQNKVTHWVWDGNNPLHEWVKDKYIVPAEKRKVVPVSNDDFVPLDVVVTGHPPTGPPEISTANKPTFNENLLFPRSLITWLFEPESFTPIAKIVDDKQYSIVTDYLGTPIAMLDQFGSKVWSADISVYGNLRNLEGKQEDCPFRWPGQYEDIETGLYYNRFRYYDVETGQYISQDPIGLDGGDCLYGYVSDSLSFFDPTGLAPYHRKNGQFGKKRGRRRKVSTHGNAKISTRPAVLYAQYDGDGNFKKWGITQNVDNPRARYGNTIPADWDVVEIDRGSRSAMLKLERELVEKDPGLLNKESFRGKKMGEPLSNRAAKACAKK